MKKYITIPKDVSIKVQSEVTEVLSPSYVYLPIEPSAHMLVQKKNVYKNDAIYECNGKTYYSPVSGNITRIVKKQNGYGKESLFLQIKNNFKENDHYVGVDHTTIVFSNSLKKKILEYEKDTWGLLKGKKKILLCGIEDEPYVANTSFLLKYHAREILLLLDALASTYKIESIEILVKETDRDSIEAIETILNTYPNMSLMLLPDYYLLGNELFLKEYLHLEEDTFILKADKIFDAYYDLIKMRRKEFLYVTVTGNAIEDPKVMKVKVGTPLKDLLEYFSFREDEYEIHINGLLMGKRVDQELILEDDIRAIYFMKKNSLKEEECIHCGKCNEVCPFECEPYKSLQTNGLFQNPKCISCGLCSFVCPSHIRLQKFLERGESSDPERKS